MQLRAGRGVDRRDDQDGEDQQHGGKEAALCGALGWHDTSSLRDVARARTGAKVRAPRAKVPGAVPVVRARQWPARGRDAGAEGSEPALVAGRADRLGAVAGAGLLDGEREVVADGALREVQRGGDLGVGGAVRGGVQHLALAVGQRAGAVGQGGRRQHRVDDPLPVQHPAHRVREPGRWGVLDQEGVRAGLHRPAQIAGAAEGGEDDDLHAGQFVAQPGRGVQAAQARHLDVQQCDVDVVGPRLGEDLVAARRLGDDLQVVLQGQQCRQRLPDHGLVLRQQQPDHAGQLTAWDRRGGPEPVRAATGDSPDRTGGADRS
ncbi:hypothetical protein P354_06965 [Streptomyces noursei PD-1]|nr:hypothetical protein P354_06965 [Streptomyces noursei PD-1]